MIRSFFIAIVILSVTACGSTSTESVVGPSAAKCSVSLTGPESAVDASGAPGSITVNTTPECEWTATAEGSWITELAPTQGQGGGQVRFQASPNPNGTVREGAIAVNGQRALIRQNASTCEFTVVASNDHFGSAGGAGTINVSVPGGCPWTAASTVSWIAVSPASGSGSGSAAFTVAAAGVGRTGTITVGGMAIGITQDAPGATPSPSPSPSCVPSLSPLSTSVPAAGGPGTVGITLSAGCPWTASSLVPWIALTMPASGNGNGSVGFTVAANTATAGRIGSVTIGGATFTVNQAGSSGSTCTTSINPTSQSVGAAGGAGTAVTVSAGAGCTWSASSNAAWLTITSGASGSGGGTVNFTIAANAGAARNGTLTIAGQTFTVTQTAPAPACSYSIDPSSITVGDEEVRDLQVAVTAGNGCSWNATSNVPWVKVTSGSSGSGNGSVIYKVDKFGGTSRSGTMTIAGRTFTVTQIKCQATLTPDTQAVSGLGGLFTVSITTQTGCPWQAVESLSWVTIISGSDGTGSGTVQYAVLPNPGGARSGNIAIAGETLKVNQAKAP